MSFTRAIPRTASIDSSSTQNIARNIFHRSIPIFRTCTFRGITPSLLKSPTRKARNEFQLPALANIRSTSPTRDATDSKADDSWKLLRILPTYLVAVAPCDFAICNLLFVMPDENRPTLHKTAGKNPRRWRLKRFVPLEMYFCNKRSQSSGCRIAGRSNENSASKHLRRRIHSTGAIQPQFCRVLTIV